jgi:hypothetical protein
MQRTYLRLLVAELRRLEPTHVIIFCDEDYYPVLHEALYHWPSRQMAIWDKGRIGLGRGFRKQHELLIHASPEQGHDLITWAGQASHASILRFKPVPRHERKHGAQKPENMIRYLVKATTIPGGICLDPFMGSGTAGVSAVALGCQFIGIEIERKYFDIACERIENAQLQSRLFTEPLDTPGFDGQQDRYPEPPGRCHVDPVGFSSSSDDEPLTSD